MSKTLQWIIGIGVTVVVVAVVFATLWPLFSPRAAWTSYGGMGPGHMLGGGGMMGGMGMPLIGLGMLLWPLLVIGLVVIGAVWVVRSFATPGPRLPPAPSGGATCQNCGGQLQAGWKACPYCGEKV